MFLAYLGHDKKYIRRIIIDEYYPQLESLKYEELLRTYGFRSLCQNCVPKWMRVEVMLYLQDEMVEIINKFEENFKDNKKNKGVNK